MKQLITANWYKAIMASSCLIFACGFFIFSINSNKAYGHEPQKKLGNNERTCVGGVYSPSRAMIYAVWSDGTNTESVYR